jgi:uncharacterized protein YeaO (DUF488 family)
MQTSNFKKSFSDPLAVAIVRFKPRNFKGRWYPKLAPSAPLLAAGRSGKLTGAKWRKRFEREVLAKLDPKTVAKELGQAAILCCYEGEGDDCHRHYVAEWLQAAGITIDETPYDD